MNIPFKFIWPVLKQSFSDFVDDRVLKLSADLYFYTIFSLPAMLIIIISVSDIFYGRAAIEGTLFNQISGFIGTDAALQIQHTISNAALSNSNRIAPENTRGKDNTPDTAVKKNVHIVNGMRIIVIPSVRMFRMVVI